MVSLAVTDQHLSDLGHYLHMDVEDSHKQSKSHCGEIASVCMSFEIDKAYALIILEAEKHV